MDINDVDMDNLDLLLDSGSQISSKQIFTGITVKEPQPSSSSSTESNANIANETTRLSNENFKIVRHASDNVRKLIATRDNLCRFQETNVRLFGQGIRPRWLGHGISRPVLPGTAVLPRTFHDKWNAIIQHCETSLQELLSESLPSLIDVYDADISKAICEALNSIRTLLIDQDPA